MSEYHTPVMLDESVSALVINPDGVYADATFGGGGHTAELLSRLHDGARVIALTWAYPRTSSTPRTAASRSATRTPRWTCG